jgi:hypothetical protein
LAQDPNTGSSGFSLATPYSAAIQPTPLMTPAELLAHTPETNPVVKIDIEGFEHEAILGSKAVFRAGGVRALIVEPNEHLLRKRKLDVEMVPKLRRSCGYEQAANCDCRV